jgi:hypothetical protein
MHQNYWTSIFEKKSINQKSAAGLNQCFPWVHSYINLVYNVLNVFYFKFLLANTPRGIKQEQLCYFFYLHM